MGTVWIVGVGPGDPGLLTQRAVESLRQADIVLYDPLVAPEILDWVRQTVGAPVIVADEQTNRLTVDHARQGKCVCLLFADPCTDERATVIVELLKREGVSCRLVPGISPILAAPFYAGVPIVPDGTGAVTLLTRMPRGSAATLASRAFAASSASTLVFQGTPDRIQSLTSEMIQAGFDPEVPAAVVHSGTTNRQQTIVGTLSDFRQRMRNGEGSAVLVVGSAACDTGTGSWWEKRPLFGKKILVTRPAERSRQLVELLWDAGAEVEVMPLIEVEVLPDLEPLRVKLAHAGDYKWLVVTSAEAVHALWRCLREMGCDARKLGSMKIAAVGPGTASRLREIGIVADLVPEKGHAEHLIQPLLEQTAPGDRILFPGGNLAMQKPWQQSLADAGRLVDGVVVYRTTPVDLQAEKQAHLRAALAEGNIQAVTLTSPSTVDQLTHTLGGDDAARSLCSGTVLACIGRTTAAQAKKHGLTVSVTAERPTPQSLVQGLIDHFSGGVE